MNNPKRCKMLTALLMLVFNQNSVISGSRISGKHATATWICEHADKQLLEKTTELQLQRCPLAENITPCRCHVTTKEELWVECNSREPGHMFRILKSEFSNVTIDSLYVTDSLVTELDEEVLRNVTVRRLYLHHLQLQYIAPEALLPLKDSLELLEIQMNEIGVLPIHFGFPQLVRLTLVGNPITEIQIAPSRNLQVFHLTGSLVDHIDGGAFGEMRELRRLVLSANKIATITGPFAGLINLQEIWLDRNEIETIPANCFQDLPNLKILNLAHNKINSFAADALTGLTIKSIKSVYISNNKLSYIAPKIYANWTSLKTIDLAANQIETADNWFSEENVVREVILTDNKIRNISQNSMWSQSLHHLRLDRNLISEVNSKLTDNAHSLESLDLSNNRISKINVDAFGKNRQLKLLLLQNNLIEMVPFLNEMRNLHMLDLSNNFISNFETALVKWSEKSRKNKNSEVKDSVETNGRDEELPNLQYLYLDGNSFQTLSKATTPFMPKLRILHLNYNNISSVGDSTLQSFTETMTELAVKRNEIGHVGELAFSNLTKLRIVDLRDNHIQWLSNKSFADTSGTIIRLDGNNIHCNCNLRWIANVAEKAHIWGTCSQPEHLNGISVNELKPEDFCTNASSSVLTLQRVEAVESGVWNYVASKLISIYAYLKHARMHRGVENGN